MPIEFDTSGFEKSAQDMAARVKARDKKAVEAGAEVLRVAVEARAPRGPTGILEANIIKTEPAAGADGAVYSFVGPRDVGGATYEQRGAMADKGKGTPFWGRMVEFGTSKMPARPFEEPAFQASKGDVLHAMAEVMKEAVEGNGDV
jgi:HK97 gp10 family phage protein